MSLIYPRSQVAQPSRVQTIQGGATSSRWVGVGYDREPPAKALVSPNYFEGKVGPFYFRFYSADRGEDPHVHVIHGRARAKIWLESPPRVEYSRLKPKDEKKALRVVDEHRKDMLRTWYDFFK